MMYERDFNHFKSKKKLRKVYEEILYSFYFNNDNRLDGKLISNGIPIGGDAL